MLDVSIPSRRLIRVHKGHKQSHRSIRLFSWNTDDDEQILFGTGHEDEEPLILEREWTLPKDEKDESAVEWLVLGVDRGLWVFAVMRESPTVVVGWRADETAKLHGPQEPRLSWKLPNRVLGGVGLENPGLGGALVVCRDSSFHLLVVEDESSTTIIEADNGGGGLRMLSTQAPSLEDFSAQACAFHTFSSDVRVKSPHEFVAQVALINKELTVALCSVRVNTDSLTLQCNFFQIRPVSGHGELKSLALSMTAPPTMSILWSSGQLQIYKFPKQDNEMCTRVQPGTLRVTHEHHLATSNLEHIQLLRPLHPHYLVVFLRDVASVWDLRFGVCHRFEKFPLQDVKALTYKHFASEDDGTVGILFGATLNRHFVLSITLPTPSLARAFENAEIQLELLANESSGMEMPKFGVKADMTSCVDALAAGGSVNSAGRIWEAAELTESNLFGSVVDVSQVVDEKNMNDLLNSQLQEPGRISERMASACTARFLCDIMGGRTSDHIRSNLSKVLSTGSVSYLSASVAFSAISKTEQPDFIGELLRLDERNVLINFLGTVIDFPETELARIAAHAVSKELSSPKLGSPNCPLLNSVLLCPHDGPPLTVALRSLAFIEIVCPLLSHLCSRLAQNSAFPSMRAAELRWLGYLMDSHHSAIRLAPTKCLPVLRSLKGYLRNAQKEQHHLKVLGAITRQLLVQAKLPLAPANPSYSTVRIGNPVAFATSANSA
mmetsp:Transcript_4826/g.9755  ORF Transcript_4826/g.9755 Transcript_4826/m.9755 type:complete len:721 (-) Transcript_4826:38-2200(-)